MAYTAQQVYDEVCSTLLEDGGLVFVYTEAAFLKDLSACLAEFMQATGIVKKFVCLPLKAGVSEYQYPATGMEVQAAYADNGHLYDANTFDVDQANPDWRRDIGTPRSWKSDQLAANVVEVAPAPDTNGREVQWTKPFLGTFSACSDPYDLDVTAASPVYGTISQCDGDCYVEFSGPMFGTIGDLVVSDSNLALVVTAQPKDTTLTLDTVLELIPDSLAPYLVWSVLERLWSSDGEAKDVSRARYARARRVEGVNICKAISGELALEKV